MDLIAQLDTTSQRFSNCLAYVPLNQLSEITSALCLLIHHTKYQEEEKFAELNTRFIHIIEIVEDLMSVYKSNPVSEAEEVKW
ncbi:hypothetical protein EFB08_10565 [Rufibacter latericius]|uniref:Uncharacterized protein n=1 Tax=Rufibacter latericius TaxID=2487040 RepID=A0A3M9MMZ5_9BACT|nr:hypothetical protein EFB08_10565 [Rufibacter latericius]